MSFLAGSLVARRFLIEELAGQGGMGEVFRARDVTTGERVAIKLLHGRADAAEDIERFAREARLLSSLKHAGIVSYLSHGQTQEGRPFLVIEWLTGQDLAQRLARGPLRIQECVTLLTAIADALAFAHGRGVVHRDIKPSNLFLRDDRVERVTLLDFGIARSISGGTTLTRTGQLVGTPGYMAPEQARGARDLGPSADIFALGCVLFECLIGRPPFVADDMIAVLAKVLFEEPPPIEALRPGTPAPIADLIARMLDKDPARRPADAGALSEELARLDLRVSAETLASASLSASLSASPAPSALSDDALQLLCVVLAIPGAPRAPVGSADGTAARGEHPDRETLRARLSRLGGRAEWLADGSLAVVVSPSASALEQAALAARCALAVQEQWPDARVALTMGRGKLKRELPVGEAIERAAALLRHAVGSEPTISEGSEAASAAQGGVWLDELTTRLLEARFIITSASGQAVLSGERATVDETRPLLGRPTPCVGRDQELAMMWAAFDACVEDAQPSGALIIAPPGVGKSRLKHEFLRRLEARPLKVLVLSGSGAPMSAGSPYGLLGEALRRLCDVRVGEPLAAQEEKVRRRAAERVKPADAGRVGEFVAALCGIAVEEPSALLRAAQSDPKIMAEQIHRAFLELLSAECEARPCVLVLEDLHWGDAATVKLIDAAMAELREQPLFVLALARPEVTDLFPKLWEARLIQRIRLRVLSKKAAERLVMAVLGAEAAAGAVQLIVEQAAGNALFLEELIRAAAEGKLDEQPHTVLAMLQARLSCLELPARRALCSASIVGQSFWRGAVLALLGEGRDTTRVEGLLSDLVHLEIIERQRSSRFPEETEYKFRHALVRDAAYRLISEGDRVLGHRLAGLWLEHAGEADPVVLAEHAYEGGLLPRAALHYLQAAEQSYQKDDFDGMFARADRGLACGAAAEVRGRLLALKLEACVWRLDWQTGLVIGREALSLLPRGSLSWSQVASSLLMMTGNLCLTDEFDALVSALVAIEPEPHAIAANLSAVALAVSLLAMMGAREPALRLIAREAELEARLPEIDLLARGQVALSHWSVNYQLGDDPWEAYKAGSVAVAAFEEACSSRWGGMAKDTFAMAAAALGDRAEAERMLREYLEKALRTNDAFAISTARFYLMILLAERCEPERREEIAGLARELLLHGAMEDTIGVSHGALARVHLFEGRLAEARASAEKSLDIMKHIRCWRAPVYATLIEALLGEGRAAAARQVAEEALHFLQSIGGRVGYGGVLLGLAIADARAAAGDMAAAREVLAETLSAIESCAARISDPAVKARYLEVSENARARELGRLWLAAS